MTFNSYRQFGFSVLPNALLSFYHDLNVSDAEFLIIVQLESFMQSGNDFPSEKQLAVRTNLSPSEAGGLLQNLIEKKLLNIVQTHDKNGKILDKYDLNPLYTKLDEYLAENYPIDKQANSKAESKQINPAARLVQQFEIEFGRLLSPIEREEIAAWISQDHYQPDVIQLALRQAVLSHVYNFKYVDRILLNWQRMNLRSAEDVKSYLGRN